LSRFDVLFGIREWKEKKKRDKCVWFLKGQNYPYTWKTNTQFYVINIWISIKIII
jgi:hypothetical protein